jgi:hypothetical protein
MKTNKFLVNLLSVSGLASSSWCLAWERIALPSPASCAFGDPYYVYYHQGASDNLVVEFDSGGACWDAETCAPDSITYRKQVDDYLETYFPNPDGIYLKDPKNPVAEYSHVLIPYCTGDLHWGDRDRTYVDPQGSAFTVRHRGAVNASMAIDWIKQKFSGSLKKALITGLSGGSYGAIYWTPFLREIFPNVSMVQFGDSGAGVVSQAFWRKAVEVWNVTTHAPVWIPELDPKVHPWGDLGLSDFYIRVAAHYKDVVFSQFSTAQDLIQKFFWVKTGGAATDWSDKMRGSFAEIRKSRPNFTYYVAPYDDHGVLPYETFFDGPAENEVPFFEWFKGLISSYGIPEPSVCEVCE